MSVNSNKIQTIGLCRRAGKLVTGFDAVTREIANKKAAGVVVTSDISEKTLKEVNFCADKNNVKVLQIPDTMDDIEKVLKKHTGVMAILDKGLYKSLCEQ
jgi:ribosomal protein L7Ae-like RNA K-turn-binding protein